MIMAFYYFAHIEGLKKQKKKQKPRSSPFTILDYSLVVDSVPLDRISDIKILQGPPLASNPSAVKRLLNMRMRSWKLSDANGEDSDEAANHLHCDGPVTHPLQPLAREIYR